MRAITVNEYGAPPALTEVPDPQPGPGQVLIRVEAAGMNPMDRVIADGGLQEMMPASFPLVLGADLAGVIDAVIEEAPLARVPKGLNPSSAAALPTAGGAALRIVSSLEPLEGKVVLLVGAAGGIGTFATQLAANAGGRVIVVARASANNRMRA